MDESWQNTWFLGLFDGPEIKLRWSKQISIEKTCNEPTFPTLHLITAVEPRFDLKGDVCLLLDLILASFEKAKKTWDWMSWVKTTYFEEPHRTCFRILSSKQINENWFHGNMTNFVQQTNWREAITRPMCWWTSIVKSIILYGRIAFPNKWEKTFRHTHKTSLLLMMFWSLPLLWRPLVVFENDVISGKCPRRVVLRNRSSWTIPFFADHFL